MTLAALIIGCTMNAAQAQWNLNGNAGTGTSFLGTTNNFSLRMYTNNKQRMIIDSLGRVGIGIAAPKQILTVQVSGSVPAATWITAGAPLYAGFGETTSGNADFVLSMASPTNNVRPVFIGRRSRGTLAIPAVTANNDNIMSFLASAYDGSGFQNPASIDFYVDGTPAAGSVPARISFVTGSSSSTRLERLKIGNTGDITMNATQFFLQKTNGFIGVGTITPAARLDVKGDALINGITIGRGGAANLAENTALGSAALAAITTGLFNTATGYQSLNSNLGGGNNTATGALALKANTAGNGNTATGAQSLKVNTTGNNNTANGESALTNNTTGINNTATGKSALFANTTANNNTAVGSGVLKVNTTGAANTAIGSDAFNTNITGSNNTGLGSFTRVTVDGLTNATAVGAFAEVGASNSLVLGSVAGFFTQATNVGIGTTTPTARLDVVGKIKISDSTQGAGKVLTSDANGLASWQTISTSGGVSTIGAIAATSNANGAVITGNSLSLAPADSTNGGVVTTSTQKFSGAKTFNSDLKVNDLTVGRGGGNISGNTALGEYALSANTTGIYNTANGVRALYSNTTGDDNTANGTAALYKNTTGSYNTANGDGALYANTTGNSNTANGVKALFRNTIGSNNTANGYFALSFNSTGYSNVAMGTSALYSNGAGNNLVAIGDSALYYQIGGLGFSNALGSKALYNNTTGAYNNAFGTNALFSNNTGSNNTAMGNRALYNSKGSDNTANGYNSLFANTTGSKNTAHGSSALYLNATGIENTASGYNALYNNSTGNSNVAFGNTSLAYNNGSNNTAVGSFSFNAGSIVVSAYTNSTALGFNTAVTGSNMVRLGSSAVTSIGGQVGFTTISDGRFKTNVEANVPGISFINKLRPVTYHLNVAGIDKYTGVQLNTNEDRKARDAKSRIYYTGFIAQEVEKAAKEIGYDFSGVDAPKNDKDMYGLRYAEFVVPLVKAVQELSTANNAKDAAIAELKNGMAAKDAALTTLQNEVAAIKAMLQGSNAKPVVAINQQDVNFETAYLEQNIPNPPAGNFTKINYNILTGATRAEMVIVDNAGRKIKTISLNTFGKGVLNVDTKGLATGTYSYSMMVDGKVIDTKQMVVVK